MDLAAQLPRNGSKVFRPLMTNKSAKKQLSCSFQTQAAANQATVVAEIITDLIRFGPEICICNGH